MMSWLFFHWWYFCSTAACFFERRLDLESIVVEITPLKQHACALCNFSLNAISKNKNVKPNKNMEFNQYTRNTELDLKCAGTHKG